MIIVPMKLVLRAKVLEVQVQVNDIISADQRRMGVAVGIREDVQ